MVASETSNSILTLRAGSHQPTGRGWRASVFAGLTTAVFVFGGAAWAAESKGETKGDAKGDAVIESELRKALLGKSALTGELLMKTGEELKQAAPAKSSSAGKTAAKDSKDAKDIKASKEVKEVKGAEPPIGKKMAMPVADAPVAKTAEAGAAGAGARELPAASTKTGSKKPADAEQVARGLAGDSHSKPHWGYTGAIGPDAWAKLSAEFATCAKGRRQSPIDLVDAELSPLTLEQVKFDYAPAAFQVVHNGHTIEVRPGMENQIVARSKKYKLLQFHFHHPSEERFNGKGFPLNAHFVHRSEDGELAVVTVLFEEGAANPELQRLWDYMPLDANDSMRSAEGVTFNPVSMLPADRAKYLQYIGSLTTPPCTEGVVWIVLRQPVTASPEQIALFRKMVGMNARPVQPVNGRLIKAAN
jgi:carbonic anhydrase